MAKTKQHHKRSMKIPIAVVGGFSFMAYDGYRSYKGGGLPALGKNLVYNTTGFNLDADNRWEMRGIMRGWGPVVGGFIIHKVANKIGLNRIFAKLPVCI